MIPKRVSGVIPKPSTLMHQIPVDCDREKHRPTIFCDCGPVPHPSNEGVIVHRGADWKPSNFNVVIGEAVTENEWAVILAWMEFFDVARSPIGSARCDGRFEYKKPEVA